MIHDDSIVTQKFKSFHYFQKNNQLMPNCELCKQFVTRRTSLSALRENNQVLLKLCSDCLNDCMSRCERGYAHVPEHQRKTNCRQHYCKPYAVGAELARRGAQRDSDSLKRKISSLQAFQLRQGWNPTIPLPRVPSTKLPIYF
jgi:hypothetical protein